MQPTRIASVVAIALLVSLGAATAVAAGQGAEGYAGAHVSFDTSENAVEDYTVDGAEMFERAAVQSVEDARSGGGGVGLGASAGAGVDLSAVSGIAGARVSGVARARTSANVGFEGSAAMHAHDNSNGVMVLEAGGEEQLVEVAVPASARAEAESDVVVSTRNDGAEGSFIVVGQGNASVNDAGNVTAHLGERARLVFRAHTEGADRDDRRQERMIADEHVAAELQFVGQTDGRVDGAEYLRNTEAEGRQMSGDRVEATVDRGSAAGKVVMVTVSEAAVGRAAAFDVDVDGEAATEVESYGDLRAATRGDAPAYKVVGETTASSHAQVLVALDHFSERTLQITENDTSDDGTDDGSTDDGTDGGTDDNGSTDDGTDGGTDDDGSTDGGGDDGEGMPGFTPLAAVLAVAAVALLALRRRR